MKRRIVKNKKRFEKVSYLLATMIDVVIVVVILLISIFIFGSIANADSSIYEEYVVTPGETFWSIAVENKKDGQDVREYIYQLQKVNGLDDCMIYPNQTIKIIK